MGTNIFLPTMSRLSLGAFFMTAGNYLVSIGKAAENQGFAKIINVVNHVSTQSPFLERTFLIHPARSYIHRIENMISDHYNSGFYSNLAADQVRTVLNEGVDQAEVGSALRRMGALVSLAGMGFCAYAACKLAAAAVRSFRERFIA